jgi:hypothetical protein
MVTCRIVMAWLIVVVNDMRHISLFSDLIYLLTDDRPVRDIALSSIGQFRKERLQGRPLQPLSSLAAVQTTRQTSRGHLAAETLVGASPNS